MTDLSTQKSLAIAELNPIVTNIAAFENTIEGIDVTDDETQGQLADLVKMMNGNRAKLEAKRKSLVGPLNTVVKDINNLFKVPRERIDKIVTIAKKKMSRYAEAKLAIEREEKRIAEEAAKKEREEAEALAASLAEKAGDTGAEIAAEIVEQAEEKVVKAEKAVVTDKAETVRGSQASVAVTRTWKAQVTDKDALIKAVAEGRLNSAVLEPNIRALEAISRETKMEREVDGVRYFEHVSTTVR